MKKWNRSLGTSKREQGVRTPPAPQNMSRHAAFYGWGMAIVERLGRSAWIFRKT